MEDLIPPLLKAVSEVRWRMASGNSLRHALEQYLQNHHDPFTARLREWWVMRDSRPGLADASHLEDVFVGLVRRGLAGEPVLEPMTALADEIELAADLELEQHIATLPFKMLLPLLFLQFPAYLLVLLGPALMSLSAHAQTIENMMLD